MTHVTLKVSREDAQLIINTMAQLPFNQVAMLVPDLLRQANTPALVETPEDDAPMETAASSKK